MNPGKWFRETLANWKRRREEASLLKRYGCVCYCRKCRAILGDAQTLNESEYQYTCASCDSVSVFNFDIAPMPILVRFNQETVWQTPLT